MIDKVSRTVGQFLVSLGWVGGSLAFSALSLAVIIGLAFGLRYVFFFADDFSAFFAFLLAFVLYLVFAGWLLWRWLLRMIGPGGPTSPPRR